MTEDGRLELDEDGRLLDSDSVVDLADPEAAEDLAPSRVASWVDEHVTPWARAHRRGIAAVAAVGVVALGGLAWAQGRPAYVAPTVGLALENAILDGNDLGGPEISPDGVLSVAYAARALTSGDLIDVLRLTGPGLAWTITDSKRISAAERSRVTLRARIDCTDPAIATVGAGSYGLVVRRTDSTNEVLETTVPFTDATTRLDVAVVAHCLGQWAPSSIAVRSARVDAQAGNGLATLVLLVENTSPLPLTVATERRATTDVEVDLSPTVTVASGGTAVITSRVLVHDCSSTPRFAPLGELPNPTPGAVSTAPGIALQIGLGEATALASYPLAGADLGGTLERGVCQGKPELSTRLLSVAGTRNADGSWAVTGRYDVRSGGVRITVGREHFDGPPAGAGSILQSQNRLASGSVWDVAPVALDGGAGRIDVTFSGYSCADLPTAVPGSMALGITTPERAHYAFEVPVDDLRLVTAAYRACRLSPTPSLTERGWRLPAA